MRTRYIYSANKNNNERPDSHFVSSLATFEILLVRMGLVAVLPPGGLQRHGRLSVSESLESRRNLEGTKQ